MGDSSQDFGLKIGRCLRLNAETQSYFHTLPPDIIGVTLNYLDIPNQARICLSHHSTSGISKLETIWKQYFMTRLSYGPSMTANDLMNLLFVATEYGHLELVKNLVYVHGYYYDPYIIALHIAVRYRHRHIVLFFLDRHIGVNYTDNAGLSALCYAVENGDLKMTNLLLKRGADPYLTPSVWTHKSKDDNWIPTCVTPIGWAIHHNQVEIIRLFYARGIDLTKYCGYYILVGDKYANQWLSPLHYASISGNARMVKVLLDCGLDPNERLDGLTPLHSLVQWGLNRLLSRKRMESIIPRYVETIKLLIHHGADITKWTLDGDRPIDLLIKRKQMDPLVYKLLTPRV